MSKKSIKVTIEFDEDDLNSILDDLCELHDLEPVKVTDLTPAQFALLKEELNSTPFVEELVDTSYEAMANDWLCELGKELTVA